MRESIRLLQSILRSSYERRLRVWAVFVGVIALLFSVLQGCSSGAPPQRGSTADAYAEVLRWFVDRGTSQAEHPVVFVEALGEGVGIGLDTQAAVIAATADFAEVRFIDDRSEALDNDVVRDDGILIGLGPAVDSETSTTIESAQIVSDSAKVGWTFELVSRRGVWTLRGQPVRVD